ncbi:hypothetical protein [Fodinicola acaciae]|uniref:hypothetical protein n=1 Tax=Fodinicola acaciae TaxID=2681555 RepID=UPI0013D36DF7|nr:hypothetical protein [Fodinicola acaciae]
MNDGMNEVEQQSATESLLRKTFAARTPVVPVDPHPAIHRHDRRQRRFFAVTLASVLAVAALAVGVPAAVTALSRQPEVSLATPAAGSGLIPWRARGDRISDTAAITTAQRAWSRRTEADPAVRDVHLLYAASSSDGVLVVLQGFDKDGEANAALARYAAGGAYVEWSGLVPKVAPLALLFPEGLIGQRMLLDPRFASSGTKITIREDRGAGQDGGFTLPVAADGLSGVIPPRGGALPTNDSFDYDVSVQRNGRQQPVASGSAAFGSLIGTPTPVTVAPPPAGWTGDGIPSGRMLALAEKARRQLGVGTLTVAELGRFTPVTIGRGEVAGEALLATSGDRRWLVTGFAINENLTCVRTTPVTTVTIVAAACQNAVMASAAAPASTLWLGNTRLGNASVTAADPGGSRQLQARTATGQVVATATVTS